MPPPSIASHRIRFASFEVDFQAGELRKNGLRIRLQDQPLKVLALLTQRAGEVVTREELQQAVWSTDTFVDFDHGLNKAINKLREALGDTAEHPRVIETLPRRGYRFVAALELPAPPSSEEKTHDARAHRRRWTVVGIVTAGVAFGLGILLALNVGGLRDWLPGGSAPNQITSIAVLPLENLTGDPQQEYLVDGIHDELITQLAQVNSLKVISRTSVMRYKKEKASLPEIGHLLGVEGVLEGTVRREGDRLHVTAQLISVRDDRHVWARSYDRDMREAPALPGEVARAVAEKLGVKMTPQERELLSNTKQVDPAVYASYLKGEYYASKMATEGLHKAIGHFHEAIDRDPGYAPAWAGMGESYELLSGYGLRTKDLSEKDALLEAEAALKRALDLDPTLRKPHAILMGILLNRWDWQGAAKRFERAREFHPEWAGGPVFLILSGRPDQAAAHMRNMAERNPLSYGSNLVLGWTYFYALRFEESIVALKKAAALDPRIHHAHYELAWNYAMIHDFDEAIAECQLSLELLRQTRPDAVTVPECGWVYARAGRHREALQIAAKSQKTVGESGDYTDIAHIYDAVGQRENALKFLEKAYQARDPWLPRQWNMPFISDELRADPRFQDLIRRTGIPWATFPPPGQSLASVKNRGAP